MSFDIKSVLGPALDIGSQVYSARQAEENQRRSIAWAKQQMQNKYQWQMDDMKKAGLNPILSAGQSPGMIGASAPGGPSGSPGSALASNRQASTQEKLVKQNIQTAKALEGQYKAGTRKTNREADILGPKSTIMDTVEDFLSHSKTSAKKSNFAEQVQSGFDKIHELENKFVNSARETAGSIPVRSQDAMSGSEKWIFNQMKAWEKFKETDRKHKKRFKNRKGK